MRLESTEDACGLIDLIEKNRGSPGFEQELAHLDLFSESCRVHTLLRLLILTLNKACYRKTPGSGIRITGEARLDIARVQAGASVYQQSVELGSVRSNPLIQVSIAIDIRGLRQALIPDFTVKNVRIEFNARFIYKFETGAPVPIKRGAAEFITTQKMDRRDTGFQRYIEMRNPLQHIELLSRKSRHGKKDLMPSIRD